MLNPNRKILKEKRADRPSGFKVKAVKDAVLSAFKSYFEGDENVVVAKNYDNSNNINIQIGSGKKQKTVAIKVSIDEKMGIYTIEGATSLDQKTLPEDLYFRGLTAQEAGKDGAAAAKDVGKFAKTFLKESKKNSKKPLTEGYSPDLLNELVQVYQCEEDLEKVWDEVMYTYHDESLANDVVDAVASTPCYGDEDYDYEGDDDLYESRKPMKESTTHYYVIKNHYQDIYNKYNDEFVGDITSDCVYNDDNDAYCDLSAYIKNHPEDEAAREATVEEIERWEIQGYTGNGIDDDEEDDDYFTESKLKEVGPTRVQYDARSKGWDFAHNSIDDEDDIICDSDELYNHFIELGFSPGMEEAFGYFKQGYDDYVRHFLELDDHEYC